MICTNTDNYANVSSTIKKKTTTTTTKKKTVGLIWLMHLNVLSFNFVLTPNKSIRFTRFRKSYVNCPAIVLIKVTLLSWLMCAVQSGHVPFLQLLVPNESAFA